MGHFHNILNKLEAFSRKYYTKLFIKGSLLFLALGAVFTLCLISLEYFLWLNKTGRLILLILGSLVLMYLFIWQIGRPLVYLSRVKRGISHKEASRIIGQHFPDVGDKLYNLFDLLESEEKTELLEASIAQRSAQLAPVPFRKAVDLREGLKYVKYLAIPALLVLVILISGNFADFMGSYKRVVNYDTAYEPPAPFSFVLLSNQKEVLEDRSYLLQVTTQGSVQPENVLIILNNEEYLLRNKNGVFEYTLTPPIEDATFYFNGGGVTSRTYDIKSLQVPAMQGFEMALDYPDYLGLKSEMLKGTGNAVVPEGTRINWSVRSKNTNAVSWANRDTTLNFKKEGDLFTYAKRIFNQSDYLVSTSNQYVRDFEKLAFKLEVIRDGYPKIRVESAIDSLAANIVHYGGFLEDDYSIKELRIVCYPRGREDEKQTVVLASLNTAYHQFYYTFPDNLEVEADELYEYFFEVEDNDGIRNGKTTKSQTFSTTIYNETKIRERQLQYQEGLIKDLDRSVEGFKEQRKALEKINKEQKEKSSLSFNDKRQVSDFIKKQQEQEQMMEKFSRQLKENLEQGENEDELNELLRERLERQEKEAQKNEKLLKELNQIADKINKEELAKRLEEIGKKQQSNQRSLEQLLELTKRYYITEKTAQIAQELEKLGKKQEKEGQRKEVTSASEQEKLNKKFEDIRKELDTLDRDNEGLKKPFDIQRDENLEESIEQQQGEVLEELEKGSEQDQQKQEAGEQSKQKSQKKQQNAGQKIQEMGEKLEQAMAGGAGGSSVAEDAEMLRQILDNLVTFSFKQEQLFEQLRGADAELGKFSETVREEQQLRKLFEHVDDSLFALSLRRVELSEVVNEQITEVYYNIDKSLESMAENRIYQGVSYQQYVLTAANKLADLLADILENMQQSLMPGAGQGQGMQLEDIIISQEALKKQMEGMGTGEGKGEEQEEGKNKGGEGKDGPEQQGQGEKQGNKGKGDNEQDGNQGSKGAQLGMNESELQELYEIYKMQEDIKNELEMQLEDMINNEDRKLAERILRQMQAFQEDLLENGVNRRTKDRLNAINYQLLKLKDASLKQGKKAERESQTNRREYVNMLQTNQEEFKSNDRQIEILDRQALPLRQNFKKRVQRYFNRND